MIFAAVTNALIEGLGVVKIINVSAPDAFSFSSCWLTSGAVTSTGSTSTIRDFALGAKPRRSPARSCWPNGSFCIRTPTFACGVFERMYFAKIVPSPG